LTSIPCCTAIIVAGGKGLRLNSQTPKQYLPLEGKPILARTLDIFETSPLISRIILVIGEGQQALCASEILSLGYKKISGLVIGGPERQDSVYKGLKAAEGDEPVVLVHDGARPFVTQKELEKVITEAVSTGAAILARPLSETIKSSDAEGRIAATLDRNTLWAAQTPQAFSYSILLEAYEKARSDNLAATDDAAVVEYLGHPVSLIKGSSMNIKITGPEDLALGSAIIRSGWQSGLQLREEDKEPACVEIYTDGACSGNPGPGGYGVVLLYKGNRKELSGGFRLTTNNRMEILSVIKGLEALKEPCNVCLYSDSRYVVDAVEKGWAKRWKKNNWMKNKNEPALNPDLWQRLLELLEVNQVSFQWVKGHANNPENERCDQLARAAVQGELESDEFYESI